MGENHCCRACFSSSSLAWGRVEVPFLLLSSLPPPPGGLFSFFFGRPRACSHERKMGNLFSWAKMLLQKGGRCFEGQLALLDSKKIRRCNVILFFEVKLEKCSSTHLIFHSINLSSLVWVSRQGGLYDIHLFSGTGEKRGEGGGYFLFTTSFPLRGWSRWGRRGGRTEFNMWSTFAERPTFRPQVGAGSAVGSGGQTNFGPGGGAVFEHSGGGNLTFLRGERGGNIKNKIRKSGGHPVGGGNISK